jgi:exoribonuclease R
MPSKRIVGVLELSSKYRYGITSRGAPMYLFRPYDESAEEQVDYIVGSTERDTSRNQIAIVVADTNQTSDGQKPRGTLQQLLGPVGDYDAEVAALLEYYCPKQKTPPIPAEEPEEPGREFIDAEHGWITFHIDPVGCRDIDDAIAYHPDTKTWAITIADAAAAVPAGSLLDAAAKANGSTFYDLNGRAVRPMLPREVSEDSASLLPGQTRKGVTLFCPLIGPKRFALTQITVEHSFSYESFSTSPVAFDLQILRDPHLWIEELMIRYNTAAAQKLREAGQGLLRTQKPTDDAAGWAAIDPMLAAEAAVYEVADKTREQGHASLGLNAYCHASSPLRRYADLVNQRILKAIILGSETESPTETIVDHLNERSKANKRWSRDLTFLSHVTPGRVHTISVVWLTADSVWNPEWRRVIRLRHEESHPPGHRGPIQIFCDPTRRNWKRRIMTAPAQI